MTSFLLLPVNLTRGTFTYHAGHNTVLNIPVVTLNTIFKTCHNPFHVSFITPVIATDKTGTTLGPLTRFRDFLNDHALEAVQQNWKWIEFVDQPNKTVEVWTIAIQNSYEYNDNGRVMGCAFKLLRPEQQTPELCLAAVQTNDLLLEFVTVACQTADVCMAAIMRGRAFKYVRVQTHELCLAAVQQNGLLLELINPSFLTNEIQTAAVQQNVSAIQFIQHPSIKLQCMAIRADPETLQYIREPNFAVFSEVMCKNPWVLEECEHLKHKPEFQMLAVQANGLALKYIKKSERTLDLCKVAVMNTWVAFEFIPLVYLTQQFCTYAVQKDPQMLAFVPAEHQTVDLCAAAVQCDGLALQHIRDISVQNTVFRTAFRQNPETLKFITELTSENQEFLMMHWNQSSQLKKVDTLLNN